MAQARAEARVPTAERAGPVAKEILGAGIAAGVIGGVLMGMLAMVVALAMGQGFWTPMKLIAGTTHGVDVLIGGPGIVMWGLLLHMIVSAGYGVLFALVIPRDTRRGTALVAGLVYGALIWAFMGSLILPRFDPTMHARVAMMAGWFFLEHLLYGVGVSLGPALRRRFGRT
jgi:hypothetical protein